MSFVGRGEKLTERILDWMYPGCYILTQVPVHYLKQRYCPEYEIDLSEENLKRTVDLFLVSGEFNPDKIKIVFRIQDKKTHHGDLKSKIDTVQKNMLNDFGLDVVDLHEIECKDLFANKRNHRSIMSVCRDIDEMMRNK